MSEASTTGREELIRRILWNTGGYGLGESGYNGERVRLDVENEEDLPSIVALSGPPDKYTAEELALIAAFAERATAGYDRFWMYRKVGNLILLDKVMPEDGGPARWMRKQGGLNQDPLYYDSLSDALKGRQP